MLWSDNLSAPWFTQKVRSGQISGNSWLWDHILNKLFGKFHWKGTWYPLRLGWVDSRLGLMKIRLNRMRHVSWQSRKLVEIILMVYMTSTNTLVLGAVHQHHNSLQNGLQRWPVTTDWGKKRLLRRSNHTGKTDFTRAGREEKTDSTAFEVPPWIAVCVRHWNLCGSIFGVQQTLQDNFKGGPALCSKWITILVVTESWSKECSKCTTLLPGALCQNSTFSSDKANSKN